MKERMNEEFRFGEFVTRVRYLERKEVEESLSSAGLVVFDAHTVKLFPGIGSGTVVLAPGETEKNWAGVEAILNRGFASGLSRKSALAGVGGGVVCDITAFAASLYMRGAGLLLVPTTLLAMVDAALGGKTGINFGGYKNMVGTFYPAAEVLISAELLSTLPEHEYRSGLAEVIKTAALGDGELFDILTHSREQVMRRDRDLVSDMVMRCVKVKGRFVEADLREQGVRAHLNLGHTFAHALESATGFTAFSHGEAVAWGMGQALRTGVRLGLTDHAYAERLSSLLTSYGFSLDLPDLPVDTLIEAMERDKKKSADGVVFVLQRGLCDTFTTPVDRRVIREVLDRS